MITTSQPYAYSNANCISTTTRYLQITLNRLPNVFCRKEVSVSFLVSGTLCPTNTKTQDPTRPFKQRDTRTQQARRIETAQKKKEISCFSCPY